MQCRPCFFTCELFTWREVALLREPFQPRRKDPAEEASRTSCPPAESRVPRLRHQPADCRHHAGDPARCRFSTGFRLHALEQRYGSLINKSSARKERSA
jgi:hypothetical protein